MCFIYTCFVLQLFEPSIFDLASVLVCLLALSPPLYLEHWHPPFSSVMGLHRRRMTESASSFSHHTSPLVYCSFLILFQICHVLTSIPFTFHSQNLKLLFVLPFVSLLFSLWFMSCILGPVVFPWRGHSCLEAHYRYRSSSFFTIFTSKSVCMVSLVMSALLEYLWFYAFTYLFTHFKSITRSSLGEGERILAV